jgi:hypothetical protein
MPDQKRGYGNAEKAEGFIRLDDPLVKGQKPEDLRAIIHNGRGGKYPRDILDAVELTESHEMIIVPVCPDNRIDMGGSVVQELLSEIR